MTWSIEDFVVTNKRVIIWTAFFIVLYLVRELFALVFLTFILCFIFNNLIQWLSEHTRVRRRLWTVIIYLLFVAVVTYLLSIVGPRVGREATHFIRQLPESMSNFHDFLDNVARKQPNIYPLIRSLKESLSLESLVGIDKQALASFLFASFNEITHYTSYFLLGILFSFMILLDFPNLKEKTRALENTRLQAVYEEMAGGVARFALVVGAAFQAQILIAVVNTSLTAFGLWAMGIPQIALLSTVVFFAGLIPVLGVFISSVPIILLAFNSGGLGLTGSAVVMIIIVHSIEAYILNPNIVSAIFKINPVLTLIILYIGHSLFGLWGLLLGVPAAVFLYRSAILGPPRRDDAQCGR